MAVGQQLTSAQVNTLLTAYALAIRNDCQNIADLFTSINEYGGDTGLVAGLEAIGFDSTDAATASNLLGYMNTIAGVYGGTATQASEFNFANALSILWAGQ